MARGRPGRTRDSRGAALLVAIVCVGIAAAVLHGIAQTAAQSHRELSLEQRRAQVRWILQSAADRAAASVASDASYQGEKWTLTADQIGGRYNAEAKIEVEPAGADEAVRLMHVTADYPVDPVLRVRVTREFRVRVHPLDGR